MAVRQAILALRDRIDGDLLLALVPLPGAGPWLGRICADVPYHLVLPTALMGDSHVRTGPDEADGDRLGREVRSVSLVPADGLAADAYQDCYAWLMSRADIVVLLDVKGQVTAAGPAGTPAVRVESPGGALFFDNFPADGRLVDPTYERIVASVFGNRPPADLLAWHREADAVASSAAPRIRRVSAASLLLNISPALIMGVAAAASWATRTTAVLRLSASLAAVITAMAIRRLATRKRWLDARVVAEVTRSLLASGEACDPLATAAARHFPAYAGTIRSLALGDRTASQAGPDDPTEVRDRYLAQRVAPQIRYYAAEASRARTERRWLRLVFYGATGLALCATSLALAFNLAVTPWLPEDINRRWLSGFAVMAFPAIAAAAIGFLGLNESGRRADYYHDLSLLLAQQAATLAGLKTRAMIMHGIRETESLLMEEVAGWMRRQKL